MQNNILTLRDAKKEFTEIKKAFSLKGAGTIKEPFKLTTKGACMFFILMIRVFLEDLKI